MTKEMLSDVMAVVALSVSTVAILWLPALGA